mgnify:CR=1 FL=1|tara:strand:- start:762 stop:2141 length:1380 start_codon:yes stop_codon:yes gene_type:complete
MSTLVTVYITNHNYGKYLEESIESVLSQSYTNFELLIIDDGSTDNSKEILNKYEFNSKIKVIFQNNKGLTISNNIALKLSNGEFIVRLDSDDYFHRDALKNLLSGFTSESIGMVFGDWYEIDEIGDIIQRNERHNFKKDVILFDQPAHGACTMFRKKCLLKLNGYDESITRQDGYELWLRFIEEFSVNNINTPIFFYRQHGKSLTKNEKKLFNTRAKILQNHATKLLNYKDKKFVCIVPVRGSEVDSRSQPFLKIDDKNLIDFTIDELLKTSNLSQIIVTTPSEKLIKYIEKNYTDNRLLCLRRSIDSSRINVPIIKTIFDCFGSLKDLNLYDSFIVISIETPFKRAELIESAISTKKIFDVDTVIALRPNDQTLFNHSGKGMVQLNNKNSNLKLERNQNYAKVPGLILRDIKDFLVEKSMYGSRIGHVLFDQEASLTIESELDVLFAEAIVKKNKNEK